MGTNKELLQRKSVLELPWLQEILVAATLYILYTLTEWKDIPDWNSFFEATTYFIILYVHAQIHRWFLLPILLDKHKPLPYTLLTILSLVAFSAILYLLSVFGFECKYLAGFSIGGSIIYQLAATTVSLIGMVTPFIILRFYREQKKAAMSQLCWNHMELSLLRSQLNPHFMFNTFNNLYGISLKEPERLPDLILQVSQLMRYQLDNNSKHWVLLKDELNFIESYIALEEERVGRRCDIQYEFDTDAPERKDEIAPMMLIPFIENAFKHGANSIESCFVHIKITVKDSLLEMNITNSIPKNVDVSTISTGIGLDNAKQRLQILYPNKKHELKVHASDNVYKVNLVLQLITDCDGKVFLPDCG